MRFAAAFLLGSLFLLGAPARAEEVPVPHDLAITLQRGNCEQECEVYRVMLFENGDVIWQGRGRVAKRGVAEGHIDDDALRALIHEFEAVDFMHLNDDYGWHGHACTAPMHEGEQMVMLSLAMNGRANTISHYAGCKGEVPARLAALEDSIDKTAGTDFWISGKHIAKKAKHGD